VESYLGAPVTLPAYAALPALALFAVLLLHLASRPGSRAARYLVSVVWLRYVMSAFPAVSFIQIGGLTLNAIASVLVIAGSFFVVRKRNLLEPAMLPLALIILLVSVSAILNGRIVDGLETALRYTYLGVIALLFVDAAEDIGFSPLVSRLLPLFAIPLTLQLLTVVLGLPKLTELDGSISYTGGYNHESGFSVVLVTGMVLVAMHQRMRASAKLLLFVLLVTGVILANYRTSIVSMAPLIAVVAFLGLKERVVPSQRLVASIFAGGLLVVVAAGIPSVAGDRFQTINDAFSPGTELIKPPSDFTRAEEQIMSGRALIWSKYYYGWYEASPRQHVFGLGPNSWEEPFGVYAHNTLVGTLYEFGLSGVAALLLLWAWMVVLCLKITAPLRARLLAAHVSFILLNQSTMPFWQIEGAILYGVICGSTIYFARRAGGATREQASSAKLPRGAGAAASP
jgi:hypothetical protein